MTVGEFKRLCIEKCIPDDYEICVTTKECGFEAYPTVDDIVIGERDDGLHGILLRADQ